jgi:glycosyltransferase involved in cell wall biosynthesis
VARGNLTKFARLQVGRWLAGRYLREAPLIIAETEFLKADIAANWRVAPERIAVVDLGIDRALFRTLDQDAARHSLGIAPDKTVLLYVGVLDEIHDLGPLLEAMRVRQDPTIELHLVGDGHYAGLYREKAGGAANVVFRGRVAHSRVPELIAAADLCVAPYDPKVFAAGNLGYSTMKIPEYLSCGRPVARAAGFPSWCSMAFRASCSPTRHPSGGASSRSFPRANVCGAWARRQPRCL